MSKDNLVHRWATTSRHDLNLALRRQNCNMQIPIRKNVYYLQNVLYMPCLDDGKASDRLHRLPGTTNIYMFGKVKVHATHTMATSGSLGVHFCVHCGSHGKNWSNHLKVPCPHPPRKAGLQALRLIRQGKKPSCFLDKFLETKDKQDPWWSTVCYPTCRSSSRPLGPLPAPPSLLPVRAIRGGKLEDVGSL